MAVMRLLLARGRCHYLVNPTFQLYPSSSLLLIHRSLSSDSKPNTNPTWAQNQSLSIEPISYPMKPKDETPPTETRISSPQNVQPSQQEQQVSKRKPEFTEEPRTSWTRADIRFVKDAPSISPVSYPSRVAPLPEDRVTIEDGKEKVEGEVKESEELKSERKQIEERTKRIFRLVEEEKKELVPFPRLLKPEKKEKKPIFDLMDAIRQIKTHCRKTFDETVEAHVRLDIDKSRSDLIVRGTLTLPHGGKKALRIAVFAEGADADEARAAGADVVGGVELIDEIASAGKIDFDKCYTTPQLYPRVAKLARILNRHGLMPDSKQGTVVTNVTRAVKDAKKNQIKFRMDKTAIVHVGLGKLSFTDETLRENVGAFMNALLQAKPAGLKKTSKYAGYVNSFHLCSTMGPGLPVSIQSLSKAVDQYNKMHLT
ncbi:hypothetical protein K2173_001814 [Erythroxylum novogranatense]|uniref:Large ribosomal subunit protein uL1c n=1 Tax=Erythroxylum novogranatense TaxID=1862640 RepID=A0AAV8SJ80_9ROSI|nr:hypothetical protein K2173_001814 [Erythroxylum novogranatense]